MEHSKALSTIVLDAISPSLDPGVTKSELVRQFENGAQVLYATETGSRLYGTATSQSDQDIKVIYIPPLKKLLTGTSALGATFKTTKRNAPGVKNSAVDVDLEFIPMQVFLRHVFEGQTYAIELLFSALAATAPYQRYFPPLYRETMLDVCEVMATRFINSNCDSAVGFATSQMVKYGLKGVRFKVLEALHELLTTLLQRFDSTALISTTPEVPAAIAEFVAAAPTRSKYVSPIDYVIDHDTGRTAPAIKIINKIIPYDRTLAKLINHVESLQSEYGARSRMAATTDVDWKSAHHAVRIIAQTLELQTTGALVLPLTNNPHFADMMAFKLKERSIAQLEAWLEKNLAALADIVEYGTGVLPTKTDKLADEFEEFLQNTMLQLYAEELS